MRSIVVALAVSFLTACAGTPPREHATTPIRDAEGHVVGHKEMKDGREVITQYTPRFDKSGALVAFEEPTRDGVVIRNLDGKRIGVRYNDLRSRGSNPGSEGVSIVMPSASQGKSAP